MKVALFAVLILASHANAQAVPVPIPDTRVPHTVAGVTYLQPAEFTLPPQPRDAIYSIIFVGLPPRPVLQIDFDKTVERWYANELRRWTDGREFISAWQYNGLASRKWR